MDQSRRLGLPLPSSNSATGKAVLTLAHVAGMVDMVALPLWIGALMQHYGFNAPQAGITVTVFLLSVVISSAVFAPRFNRLPRRATAAGGFAVSAAAFFAASRLPVGIESVQSLVLLHALAGLGAGCALSFTHGCIGRSANPHRLFALANVALGIFAVMFLGGVPQLIMKFGAETFFIVVAVTMTVATFVVAVAFPTVVEMPAQSAVSPAAKIPRTAWFVIGVVACLTLNQAMVFSFVERIGAERGFGVERVNGVLIALGLVNLLPGALAALLQKKWSPVPVGIGGVIGQAVLALTMSHSQTFEPYAMAAAMYVSMVIFTHTFLFGLLSRLDPSGRAVAATPAMMMLGSCIGPALGGALVQTLGYPGLGWAACTVAFVAVTLLTHARRHLRTDPPVLKPAHA